MTVFKKYLPFVCLLYWFVGVQLRCNNFYNYDPKTYGLVPVYADSLKIHAVNVETPRRMVNTGKIYYKDSTIYVIEKNAGIHVIDNRKPEKPESIRFIKLEGCEDIAIKGTMLYADNYTDLVVLDVAKPNEPKMVNRLRGTYANTKDGKPLTTRYSYGYFQCVDTAKGKVIAWEQGAIDTFKCYQKR